MWTFYSLVCLYANRERSILVCSNKGTAGIPTVQNWGTTFHFDCVRPALVKVEVLFCRSCTFHCDCAGIARQASQYGGSVAYLFPLTVATLLEGDEVWISDRSILLTSNLTVHSMINYLHWQVFSHCNCAIGKRVGTWDLFICCLGHKLGVVVVGYLGSRLWLTVEYCSNYLTALVSSGSAGLDLLWASLG